MKKFALGLLSIALAGVVSFPGNVGAVKADSYYEDFPSDIESYEIIINRGRDYVIKAYDFNRMIALGDLISSTSSTHSAAYDEFKIYGTKTQLDLAKKNLNELTKSVPKMKSEVSYMTDSSPSQILSNYTNSINRYKTANMYLGKFYATRTEYNFDMYMKYTKEAFDLAHAGRKKSLSEYQYYTGMALDILSLNQ